MSDEEACYKEVRGLSRGLEVLVAMNANARTGVNVASISEATGLHRTTVKRLLETLKRDGFVSYDADSRTYALAHSVRKLSAGYVEDEEMVEVARPVLRALATTAIWPISLLTFDVDAMLTRETTHFRAPVLFDKTLPGDRIPILCTAAGRAFFFSCGTARREQILAVLGKLDNDEGNLAKNHRRLVKLEQRFRQLRCAVNVAEWRSHPNRSGLAVPVLKKGEAIGSLNVVYHVHAMTVDEAISLNLRNLQAAAAEISARLSDSCS